MDESGYLGDKSDAERLERVDDVWASPLTRALQTAPLRFHGFPPLRSWRCTRRVGKSKTSAASIPLDWETGSHNILQRCEKKLAEAVGHEEAASTICNGLALRARGTPRASGGCRPNGAKAKAQ